MQEYVYEFKEVLFRAPTELEKIGGVWPLRIGKNVAKSDYHVEPRKVPFYSLHFVLHGSIHLVHNDSQFILNQGDVFCLFPQMLHHYSVPEGKPLKMFWIAMEGPQVSSLMEQNQITRDNPVGKRVFQPSLELLLLELMDVYKRTLHKGSEEDIRLLSLIYRILASLALANSKRSFLQGEHVPRQWIVKSKQFMELHYMEAISVADIAMYAGVHRTQLHKHFIKQFGMSPMQYLQKLRMELGAKLLWETNCSITEIALCVGYPDLCSYSRAHRKFFGSSPSEFRRHIQ
jgi:AraC-like DNA-binding protein